MFAPLHTKSERSTGLGTASVAELVARAAQHGYPALALTDLENLYGQVELHHAAQAFGVRAITGVELRAGFGARRAGAKAGRLVLLARDREGYASLCRVVTARRASRAASTKHPLACLALAPRGLYFLSDDAEVVRSLLRAGVAREDVRFLLVRPGDSVPPTGVRSVADADVAMLDPADVDLHVLLAAMRGHARYDDAAAARATEDAERAFPSPERVRALFRGHEDAVAETLELARACTLDLARPIAAPEPGRADDEAVRALAELVRARFAEGRRRGRWLGDAYGARLERELDVLARRGLARHVRLVAEVVDHARREDVGVVVRGSAAGSLVVHVLGASSVDPVANGLHFERFVHAEDSDPSDVDIDVDSERRDELIEWVFRRHGRDRTAMLSTHVAYGRRSALREGGKALELSASEIELLAGALDLDDDGVARAPRVDERTLPERLRSSLELLRRVAGKPSHLAVHPGGVVIAETPLERLVPLELAPKGVLVTQYDGRSIERLGLVKLDLLGNRALTEHADALRAIGAPVRFDDGDPATCELLCDARTVGCFQIETPTMRSALRKVPVRGVADLCAVLALVRPGPGAAEAKAAYVRRANGEEPPEPAHRLLADATRDTFGLLLFEEDLMTALARVAGWSLERADAVRAALVRAEGDPDALAVLRAAFVASAGSNGVAPDDARAVWRHVEPFAAYSFSKAHAASHAELAWRSAFLKAHHPAELACAVLEHYGGHYPLRTVAADFARHGVRFLAPHVNASGDAHRVEEGAVRLGLAALAHVRRATRERLLAAAPFADLRELLARVTTTFAELESLVLSGACDDLAPLERDAYPFTHADFLARWKAARDVRVLDGFVVRRGTGPKAELHRAMVRARNELRFLDVHASEHPMRLLRGEAERQGCVACADLAAHAERFVRVAGIACARRRVATRDRETMQFVTIEDETALAELVLFPAVHAAVGARLATPGPFLVEGRVAVDHRDVVLVVSELLPFHERRAPYGRRAAPRARDASG